MSRSSEHRDVRAVRPYELARALNLINGHYLLETLGKDPEFDRSLALETLLTIWSAVGRG